MVKIDKMKKHEVADDSDSDVSYNDQENETNQGHHEIIEEEMQTDEEDRGDDDGVEVINDDDEEEEDEEAEENVRTERQRREDVWYPKSIEEIEQATSIHPGDPPLRDEDRVSVDNFTVIQVLGTGAYGKVFLVRKNDGVDAGTLYAMKVLSKCTVISKKKTAEHTKTERQVLEKIRHKPFLAEMHYAFTDDCHLYIVLDYVCGGELFTHLYHREKFSEKDLRIYIAELIIALEQLHELGVIYRDIKLENVLIDKNGHIVLTDFGLSRKLAPFERAQSYCGTMEYMAPEVVKSESYRGHDFMADWWSVGVLLIELLTGSSPFAIAEGAKQEEITNRILKEEPHITGNPSPQCRDLINKLLDKNPYTRIGSGKTKSKEIKKHAFFKGINWVKLKNKQYTPAIIPKIKNELDTQNFSEEFTSLPVVNSPGTIPDNTKYLFRGFSYTGTEFCGANVVETVDEQPSIEAESEDHLQEADNSMDQLDDIISQIPDVSDKYQITNTKINSGSFADCYKAFYFEKNENCAAKAMTYGAYQPGEVECLRKLNHKNIVNFYDVVKTSSYIYLVMEYLEGGELYDFVRNSPLERLEEDISKNIVKQIASAIEYMHSNNYLHRDIKPENIMFTDDKYDCVKLIDFGFSSYIENGEPFTSDPRYTLDYAPPEIIKANETNSSLYCKGNDIWSLGTVIYTMVVGHPPFRHKKGDNDEETVRERILDCDYDQNDTWMQLSSSVRDLILKTFKLDHERRISAEEILSHDWFESSGSDPYDIIEIPVVMECDGESSISAGDLDSIFSVEEEAVEEDVPVADNEPEPEALLEPVSLPGDVQSTEENNNMKNGEKSEEDESELEEEQQEEDLFYFDNVDSKESSSKIQNLDFTLPKSLRYTIVKKVMKDTTNILPNKHSVPIKKRHNYFKTREEEPVAPKVVPEKTDKEDLELIGFGSNSYQIQCSNSELLQQYTSGLFGPKKGRARLLLSAFKPSGNVVLNTTKVFKKIIKEKKLVPSTKSNSTVVVARPVRKRRNEVDLISPICVSPRKTRRSAVKDVPKIPAKRPSRKVDQNIATELIRKDPLASTSRSKKIAVVKPLRKRKTVEDPGSAKKRTCVRPSITNTSKINTNNLSYCSGQDKKGQESLESDEDFSTSTRSPRIRILVKESYY
ncbi:RPS6KA5.2 family protein [Megaselia abdita]